MNRDHFWLTDEQFSKIEPHLPTDTRGKARVDDRRVISGISEVWRSLDRRSARIRAEENPLQPLCALLTVPGMQLFRIRRLLSRRTLAYQRWGSVRGRCIISRRAAAPSACASCVYTVSRTSR